MFYIFWAVVAVIVVLFALLILAVSMFEKRSTKLLIPAREQDAGAMPPDYESVVIGAKQEGYQPLGVFTDDDKGWMKGYVDLHLSSDGETLLWLQRKKPKRYKLITRFTGEEWIITTDISGEGDITGLRQEKMMHEAPFGKLLEFHLQRVANRGEGPVPFTPARVCEEILLHEMIRTDRLVAMGYARYLPAQHERWKYTFGGAVRVTLTSLHVLPTPA